MKRLTQPNYFKYTALLLLLSIHFYTYAQSSTENEKEDNVNEWTMSTNLSSWYSGHCGPEIGFTYSPSKYFHIFGSGKYAFYQLFQENKDLVRLFHFNYNIKSGQEFTIGLGFPILRHKSYFRPFFQYSSFDYGVQSGVCDLWQNNLGSSYCRCQEFRIKHSDVNVRRYGFGFELLFSVYEKNRFKVLVGGSGQFNIVYTSDSSFKQINACKPQNDYELTVSERSYFFHGLHDDEFFDEIYRTLLPRFVFILSYKL